MIDIIVFIILSACIVGWIFLTTRPGPKRSDNLRSAADATSTPSQHNDLSPTEIEALIDTEYDYRTGKIDQADYEAYLTELRQNNSPSE